MFGSTTIGCSGLFATFAAFDILAPARAFPAVRGWRVRGVAGGERGLVPEAAR